MNDRSLWNMIRQPQSGLRASHPGSIRNCPQLHDGTLLEKTQQHLSRFPPREYDLIIVGLESAGLARLTFLSRNGP